MRVRLDKVLREHEDFVYAVSHDLRAPLRQIDGFVNILLDELEEQGVALNEEQQSYKNMILEAVNKSNVMLDCLLEYSRFNTTPLEIETCSLQTLVDDAIAACDKSTSADIDVKGVDFLVNVDRRSIVQALGYILDNAVKFQPTGQRAKIEITATQKNDQSTVSIRDNGIGLDCEYLERALKIMGRLSSDYEGRGVGLTFAKKITELHNGSLHIESPPEQGTTVHLTF